MSKLYNSVKFSRPIFQGWWVVLGAIFALVASQGISGTATGILQRPMMDDLGWSSAEYSLSGTISLLLGGILGVFSGQLLDQYGARKLIAIGAIILGITFIYISTIESLLVFTLLTITGGAAGASLAGPLVVNVTVAKWFVRYRGWALALGSTGVSLGNILWPLVMTYVVDTAGWRAGFLWRAGLMILLLGAAALLLRRKPEDYGLLPDGVKKQNTDDKEAQVGYQTVFADETNSYTRRTALRTRALWLISAAYGLNTAAMMAILMHGTAFITDSDFSRSVAAIAFSINGFANLTSKIPWAWSLARVPVRYLAAATLIFSGSGVALMLVASSLNSMPLVYLGFFLWGFGFGGTIPVGESIWANYYGRKHLGSIRGIGMPLTIGLGAVGPILVGLSFDIYQSYQLAFICLLTTYFVGASLLAVAPKPTPVKDVLRQSEFSG
ncbi:MAG: MFS transporter [Chloroflexota bacterium]|nr:MFS transporter [Chloroflexota bacterium]